MQRVLAAAVGAVASAVVFAAVARADEANDMKSMVQSEIKAYMEAKKEADAKDKVMKVTWKDGLTFSTADKKYTFRIGGRIHLDTVFTDADPAFEGPNPGLNEEFQDQTWFRRLRLAFSGDITKHVDWKIQLDFADPSDAQLRDAFISIKNLKECWGCFWPTIRFGHQFEPMGLETQSSSNHNAFIERAALNELTAQRGIGLNFLDSFWKERATAQLGVFATDQDDDVDGFAIWDSEEGDGGWAVSGRFTVVPWAKDTCRFVHLGVSGSLRTTDEVRYRARPGIGRGPRVVDTGTLTQLDEILALGAEAAFVWNSLHAAAEYVMVDVSNAAGTDPSFAGWSVQAGWFLTGESKAYNFKTGLWGNTAPCCNFLDNNCCCWGAFELVARVDTIDLNDGVVQGGEMTNIAAGVNWYLNPHARVMLNVIFSTVEDRRSGGVVIDSEDVTSFLMRWDVHF